MRYLLMVAAAVVLVGCSGEDNEASEVDETAEQNVQESNTSVNFRNLDMTVEDDNFHLVGEVTTSENIFYYTIEQGDEVLQEETAVELEQGEWIDFEIDGSLPEDADDHSEPPIILLYGKDGNGETVNPNYVPIDLGMN